MTWRDVATWIKCVFTTCKEKVRLTVDGPHKAEKKNDHLRFRIVYKTEDRKRQENTKTNPDHADMFRIQVQIFFSCALFQLSGDHRKAIGNNWIAGLSITLEIFKVFETPLAIFAHFESPDDLRSNFAQGEKRKNLRRTSDDLRGNFTLALTKLTKNAFFFYSAFYVIMNRRILPRRTSSHFLKMSPLFGSSWNLRRSSDDVRGNLTLDQQNQRKMPSFFYK